MAGTYTWVSGSESSTWNPSFNLPATTQRLYGPAGAVLKKVLVHRCYAHGWASGYYYNCLGIPVVSYTVTATCGPGGGDKTIYATTRQIPFQVTALYDPLTVYRVYTGYYHAGDAELGFNYQCSYSPGTPGAVLEVDVTIAVGGQECVNRPDSVDGMLYWGVDLLFHQS